MPIWFSSFNLLGVSFKLWISLLDSFAITWRFTEELFTKIIRIINYDHIQFYYNHYQNFSLLLLITNYLYLHGQIQYNLWTSSLSLNHIQTLERTQAWIYLWNAFIVILRLELILFCHCASLCTFIIIRSSAELTLFNSVEKSFFFSIRHVRLYIFPHHVLEV